MRKSLIILYDWFERHRFILYASLSALVILCGIGASRIRLDENISSFFGKGKGDDPESSLFENLKVKDKIIVAVSGENPDRMIEAAEIFAKELRPEIGKGVISDMKEGIDEAEIARSTDFIYRYLPIFLTEEDYRQIASRLDRDSIREAVDRSYSLLTSAAGMMVGDYLTKDPLNIATPLFRLFESFGSQIDYEIYADRIFTKDMKTMFMFIDPAFGMGETGKNDRLVTLLEKAIASGEEVGAEISCIGGPIVAVYNARRIKKDTAVTLSIALLIIVVVIFFSFRNRWTIFFILLPPLFGALFSLALTGLLVHSMSSIALGAGTVILGISLSYSIHVVSHSNFTDDPHRIITELAYPLTVGCMTTIGAFLALLFTDSPLLQDLGLFAALALVGTTFFSLVYLPHFIPLLHRSRPGRLLSLIEKCNAYSYENKKWIVYSVFCITLFCLFFYHKVAFDDRMQHINYTPDKIAAAEERIGKITGKEGEQIYLVTSAGEMDKTVDAYENLGRMCAEWESEDRIRHYSGVDRFVFSEKEQRKRIARWNDFWKDRKAEVIPRLRSAAVEKGFRPEAFAPFEEMLGMEFHPCDYSPEALGKVPVLSEWISRGERNATLLSQITLEDRDKDEIYQKIEEAGFTTVIDRGYFSSKMVSDTSRNFNYILFISSFIVFFALLLSYGRIELTLITFLPMCVSWIILLGFMAIFDIRFNIVNIILATFIFGIGDDFSIFIMDGLLQEYKTGRKVLTVHKTAIFFSAFTTIVGMGALMFAKHPAIRSIGLISVLGMAVVILVAYTIQPFLFKLLVTSQTKRGHFPYTLGSILNTVYAFLYFLTICLLAQLSIPFLALLPVARARKKLYFHRIIFHLTRFFLKTMITTRTVRENPYGETFERPSVIVANHQSFIDILLLLSTTPKLILVTNDWVWRSPFFGLVVRYADCYHAAEGYEHLAEKLDARIKEGYSIVIFPEGTRSSDCSIQRFHKGAFYLAELMQLDIVPVLIYGAGKVSSKKQGFYIKHGIIATRILERVQFGDTRFGDSYQEQAKGYRKWFREAYREICDRYDRTTNPYFRDALIKNYIYKSPVLEGYMRVKIRMDGYYDRWDRLVPRNATVTDMGCGFGQLSYMLALLSGERTVHGIDYDRDKIELADHAFLKGDSLTFECRDMKTCPVPESDAFIFNDSLHYIDSTSQKLVLERCLGKLKEGGQIIVRDGDASDERRHRKTLQTELWSTRIIRFNRKESELDFVDRHWMQKFAELHHLTVSTLKYDRNTSETLYILRRDNVPQQNNGMFG